MPDATRLAGFARPDLTTFCRLEELGLEAVGRCLESDRAVLACRVIEPDRWCRRCGCEGTPRDTVVRRLAHEPLGWRPTVLEVVVRRYRCTGCGSVWRQDTSKAAQPRAKLSRGGLRWALEGIVVGHLTVARVAEGLGVAWNTANDAVLAEGKRALIDDPHRFDGATVIGVDEHVWRHTRRGDTYVTVIIDLTPIRDGTGPARLQQILTDAPEPPDDGTMNAAIAFRAVAGQLDTLSDAERRLMTEWLDRALDAHKPDQSTASPLPA